MMQSVSALVPLMVVHGETMMTSNLQEKKEMNHTSRLGQKLPQQRRSSLLVLVLLVLNQQAISLRNTRTRQLEFAREGQSFFLRFQEHTNILWRMLKRWVLLSILIQLTLLDKLRKNSITITCLCVWAISMKPQRNSFKMIWLSA